MSYDFSFDKKSAIFIMAGCIAIGALLFFAGFIVGFDHGHLEAKTQPSGQQVAATVPAPVVAGSAGHAEPEPKPMTSQASASTLAQSSKKAELKPEQPTAKPEGASKPESVPTDSTGKANASNKEDAPGKQAASGKESAAPVASQEKKAETACESDPKPGGGEAASGFALQLGAFKTPENALRMTESMKTRGYLAYQCKLLDMSNHLWYTVRMGPYPDLKKASQAAQDFSRKEQVPAFVRPRNEL